MPGKPFTLTTPPAFQCYDCQGCGDCCRGYFAVVATPEERERILAQGWEDDPALRGQLLFVPQGDRFLVGHREDGACIFLNEHGLCRIHARFGEPTKPLACRLYPFMLMPLGSQVRIDVRFDCPAAAENRGRPLPGFRPTLHALLPQVVPAAAANLPAPPLFAGVNASWPQLCRIAEAFERLLVDTTLDLTRQMICCVNLAALLRTPRIGALEGRKLSEFLEAIAAKVVDQARIDPLPRVRPSGAVYLMFRQLLGVYGRKDRFGERGQLLPRLRLALRMLAGQGTVPPLRPDFPAVPFAALEMPAGLPSPQVAEPIIRYYRVRLSSMGFCGRGYYGRSFLDGLDALLLTYPMLLWFARAYAMARGDAVPTAADAATALTLVDHQHGRSPLLDLPSERFRVRQLSERSTLRRLAIWYGS